jgi:hypothetical protein
LLSSLDRFGLAKTLFKQFGFTVENVIEQARAM